MISEHCTEAYRNYYADGTTGPLPEYLLYQEFILCSFGYNDSRGGLSLVGENEIPGNGRHACLDGGIIYIRKCISYEGGPE